MAKSRAPLQPHRKKSVHCILRVHATNLPLRTRLRKVSTTQQEVTATGRWFQGCGTAKCQNLSAWYLCKRHKATKKVISVRKKTQKFTSRDCLFSADLNFTSVEERQSNLVLFTGHRNSCASRTGRPMLGSCKAFLTISGSVSPDLMGQCWQLHCWSPKTPTLARLRNVTFCKGNE